MLNKVAYTATIVTGLMKPELRGATFFTCSASSFLALFFHPPDVTLLSPHFPCAAKEWKTEIRTVFLTALFIRNICVNISSIQCILLFYQVWYLRLLVAVFPGFFFFTKLVLDIFKEICFNNLKINISR
jgi:hypothetical protein